MSFNEKSRKGCNPSLCKNAFFILVQKHYNNMRCLTHGVVLELITKQQSKRNKHNNSLQHAIWLYQIGIVPQSASKQHEFQHDVDKESIIIFVYTLTQ